MRRRYRRAAWVLGSLAAVTGSSAAGCWTLTTDVDALSDARNAASHDGGVVGEGGTNDGASTDGAGDGSGGSEAGTDAGDLTAYARAVLADAPSVYLRMEQTAGNHLDDATGHATTNTISGTYTLGSAGLDGHGILLTAGTLDFGTAFDFSGTSPYTLEVWVKTGTNDATYRHLFAKELYPAGGRESYGIFLEGGFVGFERWVAGNAIAQSAEYAPHLNAWTHVVGTYGDGKLVLYVDGASIGTQTDSSSAAVKNVSLFAGSKSAIDGFIVGTIDELAIYDKALDAARVKAHFDAAPAH